MSRLRVHRLSRLILVLILAAVPVTAAGSSASARVDHQPALKASEPPLFGYSKKIAFLASHIFMSGSFSEPVQSVLLYRSFGDWTTVTAPPNMKVLARGKYKGEYPPILVFDGKRPLLFTSPDVTIIPAKGVVPATCRQESISAMTVQGKLVWKTKLPAVLGDVCKRRIVSISADKKFVLLQEVYSDYGDERILAGSSVLVSIRTGKLTRLPGKPQLMGNAVALLSSDDYDIWDLSSISLLTPGDGKTHTLEGEALAMYKAWLHFGSANLSDDSALWWYAHPDGTDRHQTAVSSFFLTGNQTLYLDQTEATIFDYVSGAVVAHFTYRESNGRTVYFVETDEVNKVLVITYFPDGPFGASRVAAFSMKDGSLRWGYPDARVCAVGYGQVALKINGQLANLNTLTGHQRSYSKNADCGWSFVIGKYAGSHSDRVRRVLS